MAYLFVDIGSTYTKVVVAQKGRLIASAKAPTTIKTSVVHGLQKAMEELPSGIKYEGRLACSSAAGGLRMVAIGLVPDLTAEGAKRAALGAGARVLHVFSYKLDEQALDKLQQLKPEIILLAGGTDGGNEEVILHNAHQLAAMGFEIPVIVAGNQAVAEQVAQILSQVDVRVCENVLPQLGQLNVEPARELIRQVFMERIVQAKGLGEIQQFVDVLMPTPTAVLKGGQILASVLGELLIVDVGGATTDVHSLATGQPSQTDVLVRGLPEPFAKRTVEGDLGMRHSAPSVMEVVGPLGDIDPQVFCQHVNYLAQHPEFLPQDEQGKLIDEALAAAAISRAISRHVGFIEQMVTPTGVIKLQIGKDLTQIKWVVGTGGPLVHGATKKLFDACIQHEDHLLTPRNPQFLVDKEYLLWAGGLYGQINPQEAAELLEENMVSPKY